MSRGIRWNGNLVDEYVFAFDITPDTPDGTDLILARGAFSRDAVLIGNFR